MFCERMKGKELPEQVYDRSTDTTGDKEETTRKGKIKK